MDTGVNDAPRAAWTARTADRRGGRAAVPARARGLCTAPSSAVELTPRGIELLEALNELFDTVTSAGNERATSEQP